MGDHIPAMLILLVLVLVCAALVLGVFCFVSIMAALIAKRVRPHSNSKLIAFLGSAMLPVFTLLLFLLALSATLEPDFRGPEIIGIAIVGMVAAFSVILGWPVSYFVTRSIIRDR